jgi:gluconolactonase
LKTFRTQLRAASLHQPTTWVGSNLQGPECVVVERSGTVWTTCAGGGLSRIAAGGETTHVIANFRDFPSESTKPFAPNGFCRTAKGDFLIADMAGRRVIRMCEDGAVVDVISTSESGKLGQINYVHRDHLGRFWIVEQSRLATPDQALNPQSQDGSILLYETGQLPRTVASALMHPNQIAVSTDGSTLYVPQTTARNVLRYRVSNSGILDDPVVIGPEDHGALIDGIALDSAGNVWGTHAGTDRIFVIAADGDTGIVFEDPESIDGGRKLYDAFLNGSLSEDLIHNAGGTVAPLTTSVAFAGPDLMTLLVGSLGGTRLPAFEVNIPGQAPAHWEDGE